MGGEEREFIVSVHLPHLPPIPIAREMEVMKFWGEEIQFFLKKYKKFGEEMQNVW